MKFDGDSINDWVNSRV